MNNYFVGLLVAALSDNDPVAARAAGDVLKEAGFDQAGDRLHRLLRVTAYASARRDHHQMILDSFADADDQDDAQDAQTCDLAEVQVRAFSAVLDFIAGRE